MNFLDGAEKGFGGFRCRRGCSEDWFELFFGLENVFDCQTAAVVFHSLGVDVDEREDVLDVPAFAVLVFGHQVGDFDSCARVEVFAEDAADSTADTVGVPPPCGGSGGSGGSGDSVLCACEYCHVSHQHVHVCQDADTVLDSVEGFRLGCWGGGEYDGGCECQEG